MSYALRKYVVKKFFEKFHPSLIYFRSNVPKKGFLQLKGLEEGTYKCFFVCLDAFIEEWTSIPVAVLPCWDLSHTLANATTRFDTI